jgi:hypothetical protein
MAATAANADFEVRHEGRDQTMRWIEKCHGNAEQLETRARTVCIRRCDHDSAPQYAILHDVRMSEG